MTLDAQREAARAEYLRSIAPTLPKELETLIIQTERAARNAFVESNRWADDQATSSHSMPKGKADRRRWAEAQTIFQQTTGVKPGAEGNRDSAKFGYLIFLRNEIEPGGEGTISLEEFLPELIRRYEQHQPAESTQTEISGSFRIR